MCRLIRFSTAEMPDVGPLACWYSGPESRWRYGRLPLVAVRVVYVEAYIYTHMNIIFNIVKRCSPLGLQFIS